MKNRTPTSPATLGDLNTLQAGLTSEITQLRIELGGLSERIEGLSTNMGGLNTRMDGFSTHVDGLNTRMDSFSTHVGGLNARMDGLSTHVDGLNTRMDGLSTREEMKNLGTKLREEMNINADSLRRYIDEKTDESFRRTGAMFEEIQDKLGIILEVFNPSLQKVENHESRITTIEDELPVIRTALSVR